MKLAGEHLCVAPRDLVWRALLDPRVLSRTLPGCERLEETSAHNFAGAMTVQVGPVKGQFQGTLVLSDLEPPAGYRLTLDGSGPAGFLRGNGTLRLAEVTGGTTLTYDLDAQIGGRIAGVGQRLLDSSAWVIAKQGLEGLDRQIAALVAAAEATGNAKANAEATKAVEANAAGESDAPGGSASSSPDSGAPSLAVTAESAPAHDARPAPAELPPPPSTVAFGARFLVGLAGELVPPRARPWAATAGLALLALLALLLARSCG